MRRRVLLLLMTLVLAGCQADAQVTLRLNDDGTGRLAVTLLLDDEAARQVPALREQLRTDDLEAAGWTVIGPIRLPTGNATVTIARSFQSTAEAEKLLGQVAPVLGQLEIEQQRTILRSGTEVRGAVDLRDGIDRFGDPRLRTILGGDNLGIDAEGIERFTGRKLEAQLGLKLRIEAAGDSEEIRLPLSQRTVVSFSHGRINAGIPWLVASVVLGVIAFGIFRLLHKTKSGRAGPRNGQ